MPIPSCKFLFFNKIKIMHSNNNSLIIKEFFNFMIVQYKIRQRLKLVIVLPLYIYSLRLLAMRYLSI